MENPPIPPARLELPKRLVNQKMPFGKFKDKSFDEVWRSLEGYDYLLWLKKTAKEIKHPGLKELLAFIKE